MENNNKNANILTIDVRQLLSEALEKLGGNCSTQDLEEITAEMPINRKTLDKYLSGDIVKIDTAEKIVELLQQKVSARVNRLSKIHI